MSKCTSKFKKCFVKPWFLFVKYAFKHTHAHTRTHTHTHTHTHGFVIVNILGL
jgi:hypothetical protein